MSYAIWIKYMDGEKAIFRLAPHSYEYLMAIVGTPLQSDWVTLWTPKGDLIRINLGAIVTWMVQTSRYTLAHANPLNTPEYYENPLS